MDATPLVQMAERGIDRVWERVAGYCLPVGLLLLALLLTVRRAFGALAQPLDAASLWLLAAALATTAVLARWGVRRRPPPGATMWTTWAMMLAPSVALFCIGLAIGVPGTPWGGLVGYWGIVIAAETWSWQRHVSRRIVRAPLRSQTAAIATPSAVRLPVETSPPEAAHEESTSHGTLWQRTTRCRTNQGADVLEGWLRCEFEAGQRLASAHLAFCPPFSRAVQVTHRQLAGPESRVKISMLQPYGARFDVKLNDPCAQPVAVVIQCMVSETLAAP